MYHYSKVCQCMQKYATLYKAIKNMRRYAKIFTKVGTFSKCHSPKYGLSSNVCKCMQRYTKSCKICKSMQNHAQGCQCMSKHAQVYKGMQEHAKVFKII